MEVLRQLEEIVENTKCLNLELEKDNRLKLLTNDFKYATERTLDKAANYIIKSMPVPDAIKDILIDVKECLKTKDIKKVVTTVVKSSIREGLELVGMSTSSIDSLMDVKNIAIKGGYITSLKNGIEIVSNNFLKNNIVGEHVYDFFNKFKNYILTNDFLKKINKFLINLDKKRSEFMELCNKWYDAYKKGNLKQVNEISEALDNNKYIINRYRECAKENKIIQNMTEMINNKGGLLSTNQKKLCQIL